MPYQKDKTGKVKLRKVGGFWHPVLRNGSVSSIKGGTRQKALNAVHAYEAIAHGAPGPSSAGRPTGKKRK